LNITAEFVTSAAAAADMPDDGLPEVALVGRSNVGKSSVINALVRAPLARTSAAPGKTRLLNVYRVARGGRPPLYLVDLPGYGYARGGPATAREFAALTRTLFERTDPAGRTSPSGRRQRPSAGGRTERRAGGSARNGTPSTRKRLAGLLLVDARHPGLDSDVTAWAWLQQAVDHAAIVATKIDKLARGQRIRAMGELESVLAHPVLPVSAVTGEGLDELWKLIDTLVNPRLPHPHPSRSHRPRPPAPIG
jgi:GTP-binding protein